MYKFFYHSIEDLYPAGWGDEKKPPLRKAPLTLPVVYIYRVVLFLVKMSENTFIVVFKSITTLLSCVSTRFFSIGRVVTKTSWLYKNR